MRLYFVLILFIGSLDVFSQDSTFKLCYTTFPKNRIPQYYSVNAKYPVSSETLVKQVNKFTQSNPSQEGYITVRFFVNCKGEIGDFEVIEVNKQYERTQFNTAYVNEVLQFVKTLKNWKVPHYENTKFIAEYRSYLSFKVSNNKVVEVAP